MRVTLAQLRGAIGYRTTTVSTYREFDVRRGNKRQGIRFGKIGSTTRLIKPKDSLMDIVTLFGEIDDFCKQMTPWLNAHPLPVRQRQRETRMRLSEVMTVLV